MDLNLLNVCFTLKIHRLLLQGESSAVLEFRHSVLSDIWQRLSPETLETMPGTVVFFGSSKAGECTLVVYYPYGEATLADEKHKSALAELCQAALDVARIKRVDVQGSNTTCLLSYMGAQWIRESEPSCRFST